MDAIEATKLTNYVINNLTESTALGFIKLSSERNDPLGALQTLVTIALNGAGGYQYFDDLENPVAKEQTCSQRLTKEIFKLVI